MASTGKARHRRRFTTWLIWLASLASLLFLLVWRGAVWLRALLIYLSHASWARDIVTRLPLAFRVASRFVAGETIQAALDATCQLNENGFRVSLDYLGESVGNPAEAQAAGDEILRLLDAIHERSLSANISVKLSQLGVLLDRELAYHNLRAILERARERENWIRIDMEDRSLTDITLDLYRRLRFEDGFDNVGVVIQAYLYRSAADVRQLVEEGARVRLCKGAYAEPPEVAFADKRDTDRNFVHLMRELLGPRAVSRGVQVGLATHDEAMIQAALGLIAEFGVPDSLYEFQMLYGIRRELQQALRRQGHPVRVYVPYGTAWYPYFVRRLAERPANLWFFISNLFRS